MPTREEAFEIWWKAFWIPMRPEALNLAFKEIAKAAWDAGDIHGRVLNHRPPMSGYLLK